MTSKFSARIEFSDAQTAGAVCESLQADERFYPENPAKTSIKMDGSMLVVEMSSAQLAHMRASLNSMLRLIQAGSESIRTGPGGKARS